ncbi:MAG: hypothetical protein IIZ25_03170 [Thermoguttaceae bacterium]|nr:hypothetical protein [Thermoguttaceae bacterium]
MIERLCLPLFLWAAAVVPTVLGAGEPLCDLVAIDRRAGEIAAALERCDTPLIPPITERGKWETLFEAEEGKQLIKDAENYLDAPIISCPEKIYKEVFVNGNRSGAEKLLDARNRRLYTLAFAELMEAKGRFLPALEETIRDLCAYPSWTYPAHDPEGGKIYDGACVTADLIATELGGDLAVFRQALLEVLSEETSALLAGEIQRRVLGPYETAVRQGIYGGMWWVNNPGNWNAVCHCGTAMAALALCDEASRKAWFLACAEFFTTKYFLRGFTPDGYCSEGVNYWNYGFGRFTCLAEIAYRQTGGEVNLYRADRVRETALFGARSILKPGFPPTIGDCTLTARPDRRMLGLLSIRLGLGLVQDETRFRARPVDFGIDFGIEAPLIAYYFQSGDLCPVVDTIAEDANDPLRGDFADAGVLICRAPQDASGTCDPCQLCAFFKGGNNNEFHNHNDLGVYGILLGENYLVADPGGEIYSGRTFSEHRYDGELLNSYGHSVPRVNGTLQITGSNARAKVVDKSLTPRADTLTLDLASAYPEQGLQTLNRTYLFTRADIGSPNEVTVTDRFVFASEKAGTFESPLVTFARWTTLAVSEDKSVCTGTLSKGDDTVEVTVRGSAGGQPLPLEMSRAKVAKDDPSAPNKPQRIAFTVQAAGGEIEFVFRPVPAKKTER